MREKVILISVIFLSLLSSVLGQAMDGGMIQYSDNFAFSEGIYLSFNEFKMNSPSIREGFERVGSSIYIYSDSAKESLEINPDSVWGYSIENNIYISAEGSFWKVINIGQLSQFTAIVITRFQTVDTFGFPIDRYSKTLSQLFVDFNTGEVKRLNNENLSEYLSQNSVLSTKMKKRLKNEAGLILALKAYNELNPIYFPAP